MCIPRIAFPKLCWYHISMCYHFLPLQLVPGINHEGHYVSIVAFPERMSEVWDEWWCSARRRLVTGIKWSFDLETTQRSPQFCDTDVRTLHPSFSFCSLLHVFLACSGLHRIGVWPAFKGICISGVIQYSSLKLLHQNSTELNVGLHNLQDLMLEPNVLFPKDQQLMSKAFVEKVVIPTCTNPKTTFNYFL